jgi:signal transduction histidine kinase
MMLRMRLKQLNISLLWQRSMLGALLLSGLVVLFLKTQTLNVNQHYQVLDELRHLKQLDLTLNADLLKSRFGLYSNYDTLTSSAQQFQHSLSLTAAHLQLAKSRAIAQPLAQLQQMSADKDIQIEHFKSELAVLNNSLRYLPTATQNLITDLAQSNPELSERLKDFLQQQLIDNLKADEDMQAQLLQTIETLEQRLSSGRPGAAAQAAQPSPLDLRVVNLTQHSRTILRAKEEVGGLMVALLNASSATTIEQLTLAYEHEHKQLLQDANFYRLLLYGLMVALLGYVAVLLQVRQKAQALKTSNQQLEAQVSLRTQALQQSLEDFQRSQAQLIQAEKMSGLGQLVAGIAHEVNNPINFIYANVKPAQQYALDLLALVGCYARHYPQPHPDILDLTETIDLAFISEDLPNLLTSMKSGADRIRDLVLSLRNFSRLDESDRKVVNLHDGIKSTVLILQHRLKATPDGLRPTGGHRPEIQLVYDYGDLPPVHCYPGQINQVLMNILANGIDALEESVLKTGLIHPTIRIETTLLRPEIVQIRMIDNGPGIPEAIRQRIFDPFYTTKPIGKGTGLGLSISYQIVVEKHAGKLECFSEPGQGTEFRIQLPVQPARAEAVPQLQMAAAVG